jgi:hypothetical protein
MKPFCQLTTRGLHFFKMKALLPHRASVSTPSPIYSNVNIAKATGSQTSATGTEKKLMFPQGSGTFDGVYNVLQSNT